MACEIHRELEALVADWSDDARRPVLDYAEILDRAALMAFTRGIRLGLEMRARPLAAEGRRTA